jgi:thermostable 8-oxoguanine DNA glycosylase
MSHIEINKLIHFIENHQEFNIVKSNNCFYNTHLGAILTDIILQAGLNYRTVVFPRVLNVYNNFNKAHDLNGLLDTINETGIERFLNWRSETKLYRFQSVLEYLQVNSIQTTKELTNHLFDDKNSENFLSIHGIGNKTIDYFFKLMHVDTIAVDRHIINFLNQANISFTNYHNAKKIVEYTADILNISRRDIDYSIWNYMSEKPSQGFLEFDV